MRVKADSLTLICTARGDGGEVKHLGELGVCEDVVLELDGVEVPGKLEQTLLVVDDEEHRVVLSIRSYVNADPTS